MANFLYAMEENSLRNFVSFKTQMEKLQAMATPAQIDKVKAAVEEINLRSGQSFEVDDVSGVANIPISGTLTPRAEICTSLSDGSQTLYSTIVQAIKQAEKMPSVREIHFIIDSPGGFVSGLDMASLAIRDCKKPTIAMVTGMAASAAYWLASQCDQVIALTPIAEIGSIGVLVELVDRSEADKNEGLQRYVLTSKNAPEKFQDIGTKEGRDKVITRITEIESIFISRVAKGRKVSLNKVKEDFGQGSVLIAKDALKAGMIDAVEDNDSLLFQARCPEKKRKTKEEVSMNLTDLLKSNPEAKAEIEASKKTAIAEGIKAEKARVNELLKISGATVSDELKAAIEGDQNAGDYAKAELNRQNAARAEAEKTDLGKVKTAQTPKDNAVKEDLPEGAMTEEQARAEAKKFGGNK